MTALHSAPRHRKRAAGQTQERSWIRLVGSILFAILAGLLVAAAVSVNVQHLRLEPVLSGSMRPRIQPGDLAVVRPVPVTDLRVGEVIAYLPPQHTTPVLHRIVSIDSSGLITKGDANDVADPWGRVKPAVGSVNQLVVVIPKVAFLLDVRPLLLKILGGILIVAVGVAIWSILRDRSKPSADDGKQTSPTGNPGGRAITATDPEEDDTADPTANQTRYTVHREVIP